MTLQLTVYGRLGEGAECTANAPDVLIEDHTLLSCLLKSWSHDSLFSNAEAKHRL